MPISSPPRLAVWTSISIAALAWLPGLLLAAADLVSHNGFEACWSQALTKPQFLGLLQSTLDGHSGCVLASSGSSSGIDYDVCYTAACGGGAIGCPVTTHAGAFSGDFGSGVFSGTGSADTISVPINSSLGACVLTISNVTLGYAPSYALQPDGNSGDYFAALIQAPLTVTNYHFSGNTLCNSIVSVYGSTIISQIESNGSAAVVSLLQPATVGESVCPLTP